MDVAQAAPFIHTMTYEASLLDYADFPRTELPVNILGTNYSALHELEDIKQDVKSRLWFTYRWGFASINGDGPTSDNGWGCMLRCGQMMLAQTLVNLHLGREWRWNEGKNDPKYYEILKMFLDKKTSCYSIHQIANMGVSEGKNIGEWFGPNTIAQVLKKLAMYDDWSKLTVHVALDNTVIIEDIKAVCKCSCKDCDRVPEHCTLGDISKNTTTTNSINSTKVTNSDKSTRTKNNITTQSGRPTIFDRIQSQNLGGVYNNSMNINAQSPSVLSYEEDSKSEEHWKPLLVIIPLRLGLSEINQVYINALKTCFSLRQSVGIIGGKPNQAHWFIGVVGDELIFLDPHTRQPVEDYTRNSFSDDSYHCPFACRMSITDLDPSIALGFFCRTEADFNNFCMNIQKVVCLEKTPMFEMHGKRPKHWPPFNPSPSFNDIIASSSEFECVERQYDTDEEFELL